MLYKDVKWINVPAKWNYILAGWMFTHSATVKLHAEWKNVVNRWILQEVTAMFTNAR
ncbi:MAG TPA: hypothetical protein VD927_16560 [Chryseosolibacter sp.]|nr:hypothetical protein [Chryseosolibacter sp.]